MDIRNWGLGTIMQLPDSCFGRRWSIMSSARVANSSTAWWIVDSPLPDRCVLWSIDVHGSLLGEWGNNFKFALGDSEPANAAQFNAFERLYKGDFDLPADEGAIFVGREMPFRIKSRMDFAPNGRRFVIAFTNLHATAYARATFTFEVSGVPHEVPDCLLSG